MDIVKLRLDDLRVITGSLLNIISKSFGPNGRQALITSSTGQIAVTCDCASILSAIHFSHPVAKVIVDSVASFSRTYGDGCKTIIIYTHELLSAIGLSFSDLHYSSIDDVSYSTTVAKSLTQFINNDLLYVCDEMGKFLDLRNVNKNKFYENDLFYVVRTCLNGLPAKVGDHLASIVTTLLHGPETGHELRVLKQFLDNFLPILPNQPYLDSHIKDGLFLQGHFSGQRFSASNVRLIFLQCSLDGNMNTQSTVAVRLTSTRTDTTFLTYRTQVASHFLHCVKGAGVSLILSTHLVPAYVLDICYKLDMNVLACLDMKDIQVLTSVTGKLPLTNVYQSFSEENIVSVSSWECVVTSGKYLVKIIFEEFCCRYTPQSLFLCAPTEGLCQQLKVLVKKSVTVSEHYLLASSSASLREFVGGRSTRCFSLTAIESDLSAKVRQSTIDTSSMIDQELHSHEDHLQLNLSHPTFNKILAGGGYFENILTHFLQSFTANDGSSCEQFWCRIITRMLEAVPKMLQNNCLAAQPSPCRTTVSRVTDMCRPLGSGAVDVLSIKFEALFAAINLVVQLLRIDAVIGVNRPVDVGVGVNRPVDVGVGVNRPVGVGVNRPVDVGVGVNRPVDVGVGVNRPVDVGVGVNRPVDVGVGVNRPVDVGVGVSRPVDVIKPVVEN